MKRLLAACILSILIFTILALYAHLGGGQISPDALSLAEEAALAYESGDYTQAARLYEQAAANAAQPLLFYNLGNAYYRLGDIGRAVLNYKRALELAPRHRDARTNLALVQAQTLDRFGGSSLALSAQFAGLTKNWLNQNELALLALGLWFGCGLLWLFYRTVPGGRLRAGLQMAFVLAIVFALLGVLSLGSRMYEESRYPAGVIVAQEVQAASGPGRQYPVEFNLHSGCEVSLLEERSGWVRLTLPGSNLQGWIPSETVERVR